MQRTINFKKVGMILFLGCITHGSRAQEVDKEVIVDSTYNKWSVEAAAGFTRASNPFAKGYYSSGNSVVSTSQLKHFDVGVRYMFTTRFGLKFDAAYDNITNVKESGSLPFNNKVYRIGLQGVVNAGQILNFSEFTQTFGLLAHAGLQASSVNPQTGSNAGKSEYDGGLIIGFSPQVRISNRFVFTMDVSLLSNYRQHFNWDGSYASTDENLTGRMLNVSGGLTYYIGRNAKHADWFIQQQQVVAVDHESRRRLDDIETMLSDADKDGVPDYIDIQNNTPAGLKVDSKGHFIDDNHNGIADEMESRRDVISKTGNSGQGGDPVRSLLEKGYVNIFFDTNKDKPDSGSMNSIYYIVSFLKDNPESKATLSGFADTTGNEKNNRDLSERRARNIAALVVSNGISADRITITGSGEDKSHNADSNTNLGLARRVSITIE